MCRVYTSRISYRGEDRLDITRGSANTEEGRALAPIWNIVKGVKEGLITPEQYTERYKELIGARYRKNPDPFHQILERESVTLLCYCRAGDFCHRHIAVDLLEEIAKAQGWDFERCGER